MVVTMKYSLALALLVAGCAEPTSLHAADGGVRRRDGSMLQFQEDGSMPFNQHDDLAGVDLAGVDLAQPPPDLAAPPDLATLHPPDMMCAATVENCFNDVDDDCNGKVNDGCPDTITVGADVPLTAGGGAGGGAVTPAHCPPNQVVVAQRFIGDDYDGYMAGVAIWCSPLTLVRGASAYSVQLTAPSGAPAGAFAGSGWDYTEDHSCDTSQFRVAWNVFIEASNYVNGLFLDCGAGTLTLSPSNQLSISFTDNNEKLGFTYTGGNELVDSCGPSQALVGYAGRDGSWLDQLQPICAPLVVTYKN